MFFAPFNDELSLSCCWLLINWIPNWQFLPSCLFSDVGVGVELVEWVGDRLGLGMVTDVPGIGDGKSRSCSAMSTLQIQEQFHLSFKHLQDHFILANQLVILSFHLIELSTDLLILIFNRCETRYPEIFRVVAVDGCWTFNLVFTFTFLLQKQIAAKFYAGFLRIHPLLLSSRFISDLILNFSRWC